MQRPFYRLLLRITGFCFLLLMGSNAMAIDEWYGAKPLKGNQVAADSTSMVMDTVYFNPSLKPLQTTFSLKNLVTFRIDEFYRGVLPNSFAARIVFEIHYTYDNNGTPTEATTSAITLDIGYSKDNPYYPKAIYTMAGAHKAEVKILSITALQGNLNEFRQALMLTNEIIINREFSFSCTNNAIQNISRDSSTVANKGELKVYWQPQRVADEYDLEWSYVDSAAVVNYYITGPGDRTMFLQ